MLSDVIRAEAGRITAALIRRFRDFDLAEECTQDAVLAALESWPRKGMPQEPGRWLITVAVNRSLNRLRRERTYRQKLQALVIDPQLGGGDDRLRLILTCCHPALSREAQVGLTLRAVCGFTTSQIARAFLVSEATVAQRLVRAKRRIAAAGIPFRIPPESELPERLNEVLTVLYLMFNEAHLSTSSQPPFQRDLAEDALWLTRLLGRLLPDEPEILGLLALMQLHLARGRSRFTEAGELILLQDQDRSSWDAVRIADAVALIERAGSMGRVGRYQLEAAIAACHLEAPSFERTDWQQIIALYDMLLVLSPDPVVRFNRAIANSKIEGAARALHDLDAIGTALDGYHLFHAARGQLLLELHRGAESRAAQRRAFELAKNPVERSLLKERLFLEARP